MSDIMSIKEQIHNFPSPLLWSKIIIHHSKSADNNVNNWEGIKRWHLGITGSNDVRSRDYNPYIANPMLDIGYHYGIEIEEDRYVYRIGRSLDMAGGHTLKQNHCALGICVIGDYDVDSPVNNIYFLLGSLCRELMTRFNIPIENILPHWAFAYKTCPGKRFDILLLRQHYILGNGL